MADETQTAVLNPAVIRFATSIAVRVVTLVAGALISANVLTAEQVDMIKDLAVSELAGWLLALGAMAYGLARAYIDRRKQLKAQALPFAVSEKDLEERIKVGGAPSIWTTKAEMPGPSTTPPREPQV